MSCWSEWSATRDAAGCEGQSGSEERGELKIVCLLTPSDGKILHCGGGRRSMLNRYYLGCSDGLMEME
jgi:hypothetical protein